MPVIAIIGGQWGDEGKGKVVDFFAQKADLVVRFSGGDNAGHTVMNPQGDFKLHIIPSGIFYPTVAAVIGNGVVINPAVLLAEKEELERRGVDTSHLVISSRAHIIMPYHIILDGLEEECRGNQAIGTTRKGIGPAFADKVARLGIRVVDLLDGDRLRSRLDSVLAYKNDILTKVFGRAPLSLEEMCSQYIEYGKSLAPYVADSDAVIYEAIQQGKTVMLEGAQGSLLDPDFGTYPYVTSSSPLAGGAILGAGVDPGKIEHVIGVFKAYATRVGEGPMPTELQDETGDIIRKRAHEYGTTTGRPRRCGWFDAVAGKFTRRINGFTRIALTRLDVLDALPTVKLCIGYKVDGVEVERFPSSVEILERCVPVYEEMPGWLTSTSGARSWDDLPEQARHYVGRLEEMLGCPISIVSVGPRREQTILMENREIV